MPKENPDLQRLVVPQWTVGDPITAAKLQQMSTAIQSGIGGSNGASQVRYGSGASSLIQQMVVSEIYTDYLICYTFDGEENGQVEIVVAKPYLLRGSTWDGYTDTDGVSYTSTGAQTMTATKSTPSPSVTENWKTIFPYEYGDVIMVATNIRGGTFTTDADGDDINALDLNTDARAWAKI